MADALRRNCWVAPKEAGAQMGFTQDRVWRACRRGLIKAQKGLGGDGAWRVWLNADGYADPGPNARTPEQRARRRERKAVRRPAHRTTRVGPRAPTARREE